MKEKAVSGTMMTLLLIGMLTLELNVIPAIAGLPVHNVDTGLDYAAIQEAIDDHETLDGHTILVDTGTYYEHLTISKSLTLIGKNRTSIVDGNGGGTAVTVIADSVVVTGFTIQNGNKGLHLDHSSGTTIANNTIVSNSGEGIYVFYGRNNVIGDNFLMRNGFAIYVVRSQYNSLFDNIVSDNVITGITLWYSEGSILRDNNVTGSWWNFGVYGLHLRDFTQDIDTSNTVNGKPIFYLTNQRNLIIASSAFPSIGYLGIVNSTNVSIREVDIRSNEQGIMLAYATNCTIQNVSTPGNLHAVELCCSSANAIVDNNLSGNPSGVLLVSSSDNIVRGNTMSDVGYGFDLSQSNDNTIVDNTLSDSGFYLWYSEHNFIYHNNFINPGHIVIYRSCGNAWDDGYPSGGNYWSDYPTRYPEAGDEYHGENQDILGSDGIWDRPYVIDSENQDNYPFADPWIPTINATIDIDPDTLNLKNKGKWITCYIELPEDYDVSEIDVSTIMLNDTIPVGLDAPAEIGDYDEDGILDLMVKFDRQEGIALLSVGEVTLTITGEVNGTPFEGSDTIRVID